MTRKILTLVFVLGLLFGSLGVQPAEALTTFTAWTGSGPGAVTFTNTAGSHHQFDYNLNPAGYSTVTWNYHTTANTDGMVTLAYDYSGLHAWFFVTAFLKAYVTRDGLTSYYPLINAGPAVCCTTPSDGFSYSGSIDLYVKAGDEYGFEFGGGNLDVNNFLQGTLVVDTSGLYQPEYQYTMWLLTRNDGTACLLKSATHPSVNAQNAFCFPEETGRTWVADNVACFGGVDENDFWSCAEEYGIWQGLGK